jgi:hypothetical protein
MFCKFMPRFIIRYLQITKPQLQIRNDTLYLIQLIHDFRHGLHHLRNYVVVPLVAVQQHW